MKMTVTLTKEEVLEAVKEYVERATDKKALRAEMEVGMDHEDRGGGSYPVFRKVEVEIE
jgi:hypothetical protein